MQKSDCPPLPPLDGSLYLLPEIVDWQAQHNPDRLCFVWPSGPSDGFEGVTYKEFSDATHRIAHLLRPGRKGPEGEVVGLLIHTDSIIYAAVCAGMVRAGMVPMPMSPRNSAAAVTNLLQKTGSHRIVANSAVETLLQDVRTMFSTTERPLDVIDMPGLYDAFPQLQKDASAATRVEAYPPPPKRPGPEDVVLYLHSSGSTGLPKPIPWTNKFTVHTVSRPITKDGGPRQTRWASMALPTFHAFGFGFQFLMPFVISQAVGLYEPKYPAPPVVPTPDNLLEAARRTRCTALPAVPSFVEAWAKDPEVVKYLTTLDALMFAGGPLAKKSGDQLVANGVKLLCVYAGTEFGCPTLGFYSDCGEYGDIRSPEDWDWMQFNEQEVNLRLVPQGDGTHELHILANDAQDVAVANLPDVRGYATSDLFIPHPTKKGLWKVSGRLDDVIVLSNAEKIVPIPQEAHMVTSPMVSAAVMFGHGREQAGVLVEPTAKYAIDPNDDEALANFRNAIWPTVEEANHGVPSWSRIFKEMILVTHPSKPIPRAAKGTTIRKQAWASYADEVEQLYKTVEDTSGTKGITPPLSWQRGDVESWLLKQAVHVNDDRPVDAHKDLFTQGFDSLNATFLRNRIIGALRTGKQAEAAANVSQNFVYEHPSVAGLAQAISSLVDPTSHSVNDARSPVEQINDMVAKYAANMPSAFTARRRAEGPTVVLVTGTTGGIGSHILAALLADERVSTVYALNRAKPGEDPVRRQVESFKERRLPAGLLSDKKYVSLVGDLNSDGFGLASHVFQEIAKSVDVIIHNAWMVHFNHGLASFEPLIAGTRKLVYFCFSLDHPVRLAYTSSVGVAQGWDPKAGLVPENVLPDPAVAIGNGYAASKYVAERILSAARDKGLDTTVLRVGQVCGSVDTGAWNISDWVPNMVKSSLAMGQLPDTEGPSAWIPMDAVANLAVDLAVSLQPAPLVLNVVHPRPVPWRTILSDMNEALGANLEFVPIDHWVSRLEEKAKNADAKTAEVIPAIKLVHFFRGLAAGARRAQDSGIQTEAGGLPLFETKRLQEYSRTMRELRPLGKEHAEAWVKYWRAVGYLA